MDMKSKMTSILYTAASVTAAFLMLWSSNNLIAEYADHWIEIVYTPNTGVTL